MVIMVKARECHNTWNCKGEDRCRDDCKKQFNGEGQCDDFTAPLMHLDVSKNLPKEFWSDFTSVFKMLELKKYHLTDGLEQTIAPLGKVSHRKGSGTSSARVFGLSHWTLRPT
ncbi:hypothetical protein HYC85_009253 [Camellia sinensis]|uniref:Uncharacterized protein n=1 Tax=Camellia sinensis TaxID=4442 RepID=A0A7J7HF42_CAMSI|nr:hypothetical protein HYC85_009253 [Camellia sinensis]